ncbi:MAG TPA: hypothetical protein VFW02_08065 [Candidatus Limnocylindrales bacterium]|nr:hypothetical protein [Candidatus Limnocylindrales bacterium]
MAPLYGGSTWPSVGHAKRARRPRGDHPLVRAELSLHRQVLGFAPADEIEPLEIRFLDEWRVAAPARGGHR